MYSENRVQTFETINSIASESPPRTMNELIITHVDSMRYRRRLSHNV